MKPKAPRKRRLNRDGTVDEFFSSVKIRLSQKDKSMVSLTWLLEMVLYAIVKMDPKYVPPDKAKMYEAISGLFANAHKNAKMLNDRFNAEIDKAFGIEYQSKLADLCLSIITLLETQKPEHVNKILKAAGITDKLVVDNWDKEMKSATTNKT